MLGAPSIVPEVGQKQLGLPPDHNERVKKKLAELEKEKKATGAKP